MTTEPDGAPIHDEAQPAFRLRVDALSLNRASRSGFAAPETVEAAVDAVDDDSGLVACTDAAMGQRRCLVRGVTVTIDTAEPYLFGRRSVATIRLGLDLASQKHAVLGLDHDGPILEDPGSTNGTFVNGAVIQRVRLKHGDIVHFESRGATRLMCRVLLGDRPLFTGACQHEGWVVLDGAVTVPGCHHRAVRRLDDGRIETGTAVATGPAERFAIPSRVAPATGFRITADGAGLPAARLLEALRTGHVDDDLRGALDVIAADDTIDVDGRCFRWTGDAGVDLGMSRRHQAAVAAAVADRLPGLVEQHRRLLAATT